MLTHESLIDEAEKAGMPAGKMRGVLREYLQVLILKELYNLPAGKRFHFTGDTYLRLVHHTKRFSEDLDFNTESLTAHDFESTLAKIVAVLKKEGFGAGLRFGHWGKMLVAEFVFPDAEKVYGIRSAHAKKEGIVIKCEVNRPRWKAVTETLIVAGFGQMYPVVCTDKGALFADKIDALVKKNRARHLFDIIFMLAQKYPVNTTVFRSLGITKPPFTVIGDRVAQFTPKELKELAEQLRPFLFEEHEAELITNAKTIIPQLIGRYHN